MLSVYADYVLVFINPRSSKLNKKPSSVIQSGTHQRGNVQFSHNNVCAEYSSMKTRRFFVQF
jgi:hypothetical protein